MTAVTRQENSNATPGAGSHRAPTLLIVEDERPIRELLQTLLTDQGWHVDTAADGQSALEWLDQQRPDLVLLDISLPGVDGFAVADRLRERYEGVPFVVMTADGHADEMADAAGTSFFLEKPFDIQELTGVIEAALCATTT